MELSWLNHREGGGGGGTWGHHLLSLFFSFFFKEIIQSKVKSLTFFTHPPISHFNELKTTENQKIDFNFHCLGDWYRFCLITGMGHGGGRQISSVTCEKDQENFGIRQIRDARLERDDDYSWRIENGAEKSCVQNLQHPQMSSSSPLSFPNTHSPPPTLWLTLW